LSESEGKVSVTLLLNGGHSQTLLLGRKDPLLGQLFVAIAEKNNGSGRPSRPMSIAVDNGRRSLFFSSSDLMGLLTDPPMLLQPPMAAPAAAALPPDKSPYVLIENFIEPAVHGELLEFVLAREKNFVASSVSTNDDDYRHSLVLHEFPTYSAIFRERVRAMVPRLARAFGTGEFPVADIECQLTAHNDGDYFRLHNDSGSADTLDRVLTYVYYFNHEPKGFSGGQFRLYNNRIVGGRYECGDVAADVEPKNNSILFFPSHCHHEVLPVHCPTKRFVDSRFTVNGWVRRARAA
jgi:Rps23 Pro-64 3,4-dihydroxylase Tpa1-like proline 4-hydroxylase